MMDRLVKAVKRFGGWNLINTVHNHLLSYDKDPADIQARLAAIEAQLDVQTRKYLNESK